MWITYFFKKFFRFYKFYFLKDTARRQPFI